MTTQADVMKYFDEHGYYVATNTEQQTAVDEFVAVGKLRKANPDWTPGGYGPFYVHAFVDCKEKMPASLHELVYRRGFSVGEMVHVQLLTREGMPVEALGEILSICLDRVEVSIDGTCVFVSLQDIRATF